MNEIIKYELECILNEIDPFTGVAIGTGVAQVAGAAGYNIYRRYMSRAAKACKGLEAVAKRKCRKKYHEKAAAARIKTLEKEKKIK